MQIDKFLVWNLIAILPFLILLGSSTNVALDRDFYEKQGFPYSDELVGYFNGDYNELPIPYLNPKELDHMDDVKILLNSFKNTYFVLLAIYTVLIVLIFMFSRDVLESISKFLYAGGIFANVFFLLLILLVLTSFDTAFWKFHEIFFPQGNFAFAADSTLKQLFQDSLFVAGFKQIMVSSFIVSGMILLVGILVKKFKHKIYKALS